MDALGLEAFDRLVSVDQKPIARTPRSNLATYTGMFDAVRKLFGSTGTVSSRSPDDLPAFCEKVVEAFSEGRHER